MSISSHVERLYTAAKSRKDIIAYNVAWLSTTFFIHFAKQTARKEYKAEGTTFLPHFVLDHLGNAAGSVALVGAIAAIGLGIKTGIGQERRFRHPVIAGLALGVVAVAGNAFVEAPVVDGILEFAENYPEDNGPNENVPDVGDFVAGSATGVIAGAITGFVFRQRATPETSAVPHLAPVRLDAPEIHAHLDASTTATSVDGSILLFDR